MLKSTQGAILKLGSAHQSVLELQRLLSQTLWPIPQTGQFDYDTEIAVKSFQSRMFLKPDGIVGPLTWRALHTNAPVAMPTLRQGDHGSAVTAVQELLAIDHYYRGKIDGQFGPVTQQAVQFFQTDFALQANGVIDAKTWRALSEI
jgi:peptidoglycan hydrolase-like protein with peptidoglycan-binding domain